MDAAPTCGWALTHWIAGLSLRDEVIRTRTKPYNAILYMH